MIEEDENGPFHATTAHNYSERVEPTFVCGQLISWDVVGAMVTLTLNDWSDAVVIGDVWRSNRVVTGETAMHTDGNGVQDCYVDLEAWTGDELAAANLNDTYTLSGQGFEGKIRVPEGGRLASQMRV